MDRSQLLQDYGLGTDGLQRAALARPAPSSAGGGWGSGGRWCAAALKSMGPGWGVIGLIPGFKWLLLDLMPSSLQGDPGWDRDPMGWEKKVTIPNAPPFQSVITQCPFAAFSVCVHTFSSLSSFTVCVYTVSICHLFTVCISTVFICCLFSLRVVVSAAVPCDPIILQGVWVYGC